ncbi:hypothetical protein C4J65_35315 [Streptomyces sp. CB09001]|uniref:hypothetical protein n=1 Tax=Streptomyces sp. CB09001 TaxID=2083284 RepID=UPI000E20DF2B|nr:hypothetical protein [Streptomyces sp. CB09001]AXL92957.1 hypothetical protein C4J65_35315 [Streptomyces sp. CB09001]
MSEDLLRGADPVKDRLSRRRHRRWALLSAGLVLGAAGALVGALSYFDVIFSKEPSYQFCPSRSADTTPIMPSQLSEEGSEYRGPGPHHVHVTGPQGGDSTRQALPKKWTFPLDGGQYVFRSVQLVVCEYEHEVPGVSGTPCSYVVPETGQKYQFTTLPAKYEYRVYEATTGELVKSFDVKGKEGTGDCTDSVLVDPAMATTNLAAPDMTEVERQLRPLVEGDVP